MNWGWIFLLCSGDLFGEDVAGVGDIDKDGFADYAILDTSQERGLHWVFSGRDGALLERGYGRSAYFEPPPERVLVGDLNGDGHPEELFAGDTGLVSAQIRSGVDGATWTTFAANRLKGLWLFDWTDAGDVDGDGAHDVSVRAANDLDTVRNDRYDWTLLLAGGSDRLLKRTQGMESSPTGGVSSYARYRAVRVLEANTGQSSIVFTRPVTGGTGALLHDVGDVDGDGYSDVVAGFAGHQRMGVSVPGYLRLFAGKDGSVVWSVRDRTETGAFGELVLVMGDTNNDGFADLVLGEPGEVGRAYILSGADGQILQRWHGEDPGFGEHFAAVGDVNGDGAADLALSALDTAHSTVAGSVWIVSGADGSLLRLHDREQSEATITGE